MVKASSFRYKEVIIPPSKSISQRALVLRHLTGGDIVVEGLSQCSDSYHLSRLLSETKAVRGDMCFFCGDGGTVARFLLPWLFTRRDASIVDGSERLRERPIEDLVDALRHLGGAIEYTQKEGHLPLKVYPSTLHSNTVTVDTSKSSQFVSSLLLVAPTLKEGLTLRLRGDVISRPYVEMTVEMLRQQGVDVNFSDDMITVSPASLKPQKITVEGDWSAAAFWYELVALQENASALLKNLKIPSLQGDAVAIHLYEELGVSTTITPNGVLIRNDKPCKNAVEFDFSNNPDLFPPVFVTAFAKRIFFKGKGIKNLRLKESDRLEALRSQLQPLGAKIELSEDEISMNPSEVKLPEKLCFKGFDDHRIVMSLLPLSLLCEEMEMSSLEAVEKSYPNFLKDII